MELDLKRVDLLQSAATQRGTMNVLPPGRNKQQKVCTGDTAGVLHVFSVKKGAIETAFKSLPTGQSISCVAHGQGDTQKDKIFASFGRTVQGITKKGKEFYRFATGLGEDIRRIAVHDLTLITGGEVGVTTFNNSVERSYYASAAKFNCLDGFDLAAPAALPSNLDGRAKEKAAKQGAEGPGKFVAVLGTQEGRVLAVEDNRVLYTHESDGPITALAFLPDSMETLSGNKYAGKKEIVFGTTKGTMTQLFLDPTAIVRGWSVKAESSSDDQSGFFAAPPPNQGPGPSAPHSRNPITCITALDINRDGIDEVVVARDNGVLQVFAKDERDQLLDQAIHSRALEESVCTLQKGFITQPIADELVVQTFSGKIMSFGSESGNLLLPLERFRAAAGKMGKIVRGLEEVRRTVQDKGSDVGSTMGKLFTRADRKGAADDAAAAAPQDRAAREQQARLQVDSLAAEIRELEGHLAAKRQQGKLQAAKDGSAAGGGSQRGFSVQPVTQVQMSTSLDRDTGLIDMALEAAAPIDIITMASSIFLEIIEEELGQWSLTRSRTVASLGQAQFSYVLRPTDQTSKLALKVRPTEGQAGDITLFIIPKADPCVFRILKHQLPPLSLHVKVTETDESRPFSELRVTGSFNGSDMHAWLGSCLEGIGGPRAQQPETVAAFQNVILGTQVIAKYGDGYAHFRSDNVTTLAILRERIAEEASRSQVRGLNIQVKCSADSARHVLTLLWPRLSSLRDTVAKSKLVDALQEIKLTEDNVDFLDEYYMEILDNGEAIKLAAKQSETQVVYLQGILRDLFIDYYKLSKGSEPTSLLRQLDQLLADEGLRLEALMDLFKEADVSIGGM